MIENKTNVLISTIHKLYRREAFVNIKRLIQKTHTADIAAVLEGLESTERVQVFGLATPSTRKAEILSYLEGNIQSELLLSLEQNEARELVGLMESDDAADLLERLPEVISKDILNSMVKEDSQDVAELMGYPDDSAGGMMSSNLFSLKQNLNVADAIRKIQEENESLVVFYLYIVNDQNRLVGVLSLKQLLLAKPKDLLIDIMVKDVISVTLDTPQEEVAKIVERYDFLSLPVVDSSGQLMGVITVDDVIDVIREEAEEDLMAMGKVGTTEDLSLLSQAKARIPWLIFAFLGGSICFSIIYSLTSFLSSSTRILIAMIPLVLVMGGTTSKQSSTVAVGFTRSGRIDFKSVSGYLIIEGLLALIFLTFFGLISILIGLFLTDTSSLVYWISSMLSLQILISMTLGGLIPLLMQKMGMDPTVTSVPFLNSVVDIVGVAILFGGASLFGGF